MTADKIVEILGLFSDEKMGHESLSWHVQGGEVLFAVACNDVFWWGTADAEPFDQQDIPALQQALDDCAAADEYGHCYAATLFCARKRNLRPQDAAYPNEPALVALFDAAGPKRENGLLNPKLTKTV